MGLSLTASLFLLLKWHVPRSLNQESECSCICVLCVSILPLPLISLFGIGCRIFVCFILSLLLLESVSTFVQDYFTQLIVFVGDNNILEF
jgi:hypothetical protein